MIQESFRLSLISQHTRHNIILLLPDRQGCVTKFYWTNVGGHRESDVERPNDGPLDSIQQQPCKQLLLPFWHVWLALGVWRWMDKYLHRSRGCVKTKSQG